MLFVLLGVLVGQVSQGDVLEGAHRGEHRSSNPRGISSVKVSVNTDVSILGIFIS